MKLADKEKYTLETESNDATTRATFCMNNFMHDTNRTSVCISVYFYCIKIAKCDTVREKRIKREIQNMSENKSWGKQIKIAYLDIAVLQFCYLGVRAKKYK